MVNTSNLCIFEGRISKDPEFSQIQGQSGPIDKVVFDLAVDRGMSASQRQTAQSNNQQTADFIHCSMIGAQVKTFQQYCPKGKAVKVLCHYTQYTYTNKQTGQTQYGHQFDVDKLGFVTNDAKSLSGGGNANNNAGFQQQNNGFQNNNNFMNAPQPQQIQNSNFEMFTDNPASPF